MWITIFKFSNYPLVLVKKLNNRFQDKSALLKLIFLIKTYVVGTQKNCLNEMVLLSTQNECLN